MGHFTSSFKSGPPEEAALFSTAVLSEEASSPILGFAYKGHGQSKTPFPKMESPKGKAPKHTGQAKPGISVGWLDSDSGEHVRSAGDVGEGVAGTVGSASSVGECVGKAGNVSCCKAGSDDGDLGSSALSPIVGSSTGSAKASKPSARFLCRRHHGAESM